jgi:3-hydroxyisobutyrate dehydrogenase-like beta-hydroxyacid dehydrogenase
MEQSELERLRAEKVQVCQQLADATAALDKVASSVRDLPKLQMSVASEKLPAPRASSGWVAVALSSGKQKRRRTKAAQDGT